MHLDDIFIHSTDTSQRLDQLRTPTFPQTTHITLGCVSLILKDFLAIHTEQHIMII